MTGVRIELGGSGQTLAVLADTAAKTDDKRGLFDGIGAALVASTQGRFETETDPHGSPWPDSLRKLVEGGRTLTDTGALVQSLTHNASDDGVEVGTNVIYAAIHQTGGVIKAKTSAGLRFRGPGNGGWATKQEVTMPQRAFLGLDDEDENEIAQQCADWLGAVNEGAHAGR